MNNIYPNYPNYPSTHDDKPEGLMFVWDIEKRQRIKADKMVFTLTGYLCLSVAGIIFCLIVIFGLWSKIQRVQQIQENGNACFSSRNTLALDRIGK